MRIQRVHIENFGMLHDFHLELREGLNTICAENGWGKSTLAAFIKAMFYGLDYTTKRSLKDNERKKYLPWQGGMYGGSMEFQTEEKRYRVERSFGARDKEDTFSLYDLDTGLESEAYSERLGEELFGLDRAAFARSSFFTQQDFAVSVNDSLGAGLTHVEEDAGDMQNYEKAVASLEERMKFYRRTGGRGQIEKLREERRRVRELLNDFRGAEEAAVRRRIQLTEEERRERELLENIRSLEKQMQAARAYGERAARKAQHDLLKSQAYGKEEQLRRTAAALAEFVSAPPEEEELDRCREMIYRLNTLRMQEEKAAEQVWQTRAWLEQTEASMETVSKPKPVFWVLTAFFLAAGVLIAVSGWFLLAVLFGAAGLAAGFWAIRKSDLAKKRMESLENEAEDGRRELKEAEKTYDALEHKRDFLEQKVCGFLRVLPGTDFQEMENRWKLERRRSQEYAMLKAAYESQRKEALRSREAWIRFRGRFSEDELSGFLNPEKPEEETEELERKLDGLRTERENLMKDLRDAYHEIRGMEEKAERIPELEREEERLSLELEAAIREHGLLEKTLKYLKAAKEQFSTRYLAELQQGFLYYLKLLEPEQATAPYLDVKLKLRIQEAGASRELEYFSAGWQDLFYIAERFSILDALYKEEQPVIILDDPFVNLDTKKQKRAMELLEKMSEKRQIIYFTCRT